MVRLKPIGDFIEIAIGWTESLAKFMRADPTVEVSRSFFVEILEELLKLLFILSRPAQLEQHMLHEKVIVHGTAIILGLRFWTSIAVKLDTLSFIDILRYQRPRAEIVHGLCSGRADRKARNEHSYGERDKPGLARHGGSITYCKEWPEQAARDRKPP